MYSFLIMGSYGPLKIGLLLKSGKQVKDNLVFSPKWRKDLSTFKNHCGTVFCDYLPVKTTPNLSLRPIDRQF